MRQTQDEIFAGSEADGWFVRNRSALEKFDPEKDLPLRVISLYGLAPKTVMEIGSSNGFRLAEIRRRCGASVTGVEPSAAAVADGRRRYPDVNLVCGTSSSIKIDGVFDLLIANFVFHWIDRSSLLLSVAEMDRLTADGGYVLIGDFMPDHQSKVRYHHLPDQQVFTYKQDYAAIFLSTGLYQRVCSLSGRAVTKTFEGDVEPGKRIAVTLLRKSLDGHYMEQALQS